MLTKNRGHKTNGHSPRELRVVHKLPGWLVTALNRSYREEILRHCGRQLKDADDSYGFLQTLGRCRFFDHIGQNEAGDLVSEPYSANCQKCLSSAKEFAERLGVRCSITQETYHAPGSEAVRIIFFKPK